MSTDPPIDTKRPGAAEEIAKELVKELEAAKPEEPPKRPPVETVPQPRSVAAPWALHCFGYHVSLPPIDSPATFRGRLVFEMSRRFLGFHIPAEPVASEATVFVSHAGSRRCVFTVIADAPEVSRRHVITGVSVEIDGISAGSIVYSAREEASPFRSYSVVLGDPRSFTFDHQERLAVRNAIWRIEDEHLSGELTRQTIPALPPELLLEGPDVQRLPESEAIYEIMRQLTGCLRTDTWGYLWKWNSPPSLADGATLALSPAMTPSMAEHLQSVTETILRACGAKPTTADFESGTDVYDAIAYALVAMRRGVPVAVVAADVYNAVMNYGEAFDTERWRARN